ncbi:hypothetical protein EV715DRAFT_294235 [Schizophyllum commune]
MPSDSISPTSTPTMRWLANAVNAPTGWPNATVTGKPNDILDTQKTFKLVIKLVVAHISKYTASNFLDLTTRGKCINAFSSWPNATANGHLNDPFAGHGRLMISSILALISRSTLTPRKSVDNFPSLPNGAEIGKLRHRLPNDPTPQPRNNHRIITEHGKVNTRSSPLRLTGLTQRRHQLCFDTQMTFKLAVARKCRQYLPRQPNVTASGVLNDIFKSEASNLPDLTMRGKCFKFFSSWPNATTKGHLNEPIGIVSSTARRLQISPALPQERPDASSASRQGAMRSFDQCRAPRNNYRIITEHLKVKARSSPWKTGGEGTFEKVYKAMHNVYENLLAV